MTILKIAIRVDGSVSRGSGHIRRCITLAHQLSGENCDVTFFVRKSGRSLSPLIESSGYAVSELLLPDLDETGVTDTEVWSINQQEEDAQATIKATGGVIYDWMIVDHYNIDQTWQKLTRNTYRYLLVIDDLANRKHDCDILLDQNLGRDASDYSDLIPKQSISLCGPSFALLRPEFEASRSRALSRRPKSELNSLLVFLGGTDINNITQTVLTNLRHIELNFLKEIVVVVGSSSKCIGEINTLLDKFSCHTRLLIDIDDIQEWMIAADLSIGAAGGAAWERCCLGLPTILIVIAENQKRGTKALVDAGAAVTVDSAELTGDSLVRAIQRLTKPEELSFMSEKAASVCDGGGARRVLFQMCRLDNSLLHLRRAARHDEALLLDWANDPVTRGNALNQAQITTSQHKKWFEEKLSDARSCIIYIIELPNGDSLGQVRFDKSDNTWIVDYAISPAFRGQGLGGVLLARALSALTELNLDGIIAGWIKPENKASICVFLKCGFVKKRLEDNGLLYFERSIGG